MLPFASRLRGPGFLQYLFSAFTTELTRLSPDNELPGAPPLCWLLPVKLPSSMSISLDAPASTACIVSIHIWALFARTLWLSGRCCSTCAGRLDAAPTNRRKASSPNLPSSVARSRTFRGSCSRSGNSGVALYVWVLGRSGKCFGTNFFAFCSCVPFSSGPRNLSCCSSSLSAGADSREN